MEERLRRECWSNSYGIEGDLDRDDDDGERKEWGNLKYSLEVELRGFVGGLGVYGMYVIRIDSIMGIVEVEGGGSGNFEEGGFLFMIVFF